MTFTLKEIVTAIVGFAFGAIIGGVVIWALTDNIEHRVKLEALTLAHEDIVDLKLEANDARVIADRAGKRTDEVYKEIAKSAGNAKSLVHRAEEMLNDLEKRIAEKTFIETSNLSELKKIAKSVAREQAKQETVDILVGSIDWSDSKQPIKSLKDRDYEIELATKHKLFIRFRPREDSVPVVTATTVEGNYDAFVQIVERKSDYFVLQSFTVTDGRRVAVPASIDFVAVFRRSK